MVGSIEMTKKVPFEASKDFTTGGTFWSGPICATMYRPGVFRSDGILLQMALVALLAQVVLLALVALFGCIRLYAASIEAIY